MVVTPPIARDARTQSRLPDAPDVPTPDAPTPSIMRDGRTAGITMRPAPERSAHPEAVAAAIHTLERMRPELSAALPLWWRQAFLFGILLAITVACAVIAPKLTGLSLLLAIAAPFSALVLVRLLACLRLLLLSPERPLAKAVPNDALPSVALLIPLHREAAIVHQLAGALARLNYPIARREILIIVEADDAETRRALAICPMPPGTSILVVEPALPRTKPKALNVALAYTRADQVVVYDAEDLPHPDQLRAAAVAFAKAPPETVCLQARLFIHNARESWLAAQFALEYYALFDGVLPAYQALDLPLPLGGTSNHFNRAALVQCGGWDPYNVTEDADLGVRIARSGYQARMLDSHTWEEAPTSFGNWLPQRTRWLKGWMQTWLVHARQPLRAMHELGVIRYIGFNLVFGGMVLAALLHPLVYGLIAWQFATIGPFAMPDDLGGVTLTTISALNLGLGLGAAAGLAAVAAMRRRQYRLVFQVFTMPAYWLLISLAAWRALYQLLYDPFRWEKTPHTPRIVADLHEKMP
ncbi:MAG: glycosyltransferase [Pseudomonadota bacterium]